jgi:hypothetical protein
MALMYKKLSKYLHVNIANRRFQVKYYLDTPNFGTWDFLGLTQQL